MENHCPISNLHIISKLDKMLVARLIEEHLKHNDTNNSYQCNYRRIHSTRIALLFVNNGIFKALDEGSMTVLIIPDLFALS